jgi:phosphoglycolate phosphatase-like HAD superfamily hydrolase
MEIKQKECFCPQFINHYGLQAVSKYGRETWEFVNLYSITRGTNRFNALIHALDLLAARPEVRARNLAVTRAEGVREWLKHETKLGNPALKTEIEKNPDADLKQALAWSLDVNEAVAKIVRDVPPFPGVRESFKLMMDNADRIVVSQTPCEALVREWKEHAIDRYALVIAGQEMGTKTQHIAFAAQGKYDTGKMLMIGDAPGDLKAARANNALFYPINPGGEEESWNRFHEEALEKFFSGAYAGDYEKALVDEFQRRLPENAPWQR